MTVALHAVANYAVLPQPLSFAPLHSPYLWTAYLGNG